MGILDRFFARAAPPQQLTEHTEERASAAAVSPRATEAMSTVMRAGGGPRKGADDVLLSFRDSPWVRANVGHTSSVVGAVRWSVFVGSPDAQGRYGHVDDELRFSKPGARHRMMRRALRQQEVVPIRNGPLVDLLDRPNPYMSGRVARQVTIASYRLIGDACWVLDGELGTAPLNAFPVPGTWVNRRPTPAEPFWEISVGGAPWRIPSERVLNFTDPDPSNPYGTGAGIGLSWADEIDIDEHAAKMLAAYFQNGAMPDAIVSLKGATKPVLERAKREWNNLLQGFKKHYKTHWTSGELSVARMDTAFKDMQLVELRRAQRDVFQQTSGTPPEKLGIVTNSNKATALAASIIDATDVQVPILEVMRDEFQRLAEMFDPRYVVEYENPVPDDVEAKRAVMVALPSHFTVDEVRTAHDEDPIGTERGGDGVIAGGQWYANPSDVKPGGALALAPAPAPTDGEPAPADAPAPMAPAAPEVKPSDQALNGAQIGSLVDIIAQVGAGTLPKDSAKAIMLVSFPTLDASEVEAILGPITEGSTAPPPAATTLAAPKMQQRISDKDLRKILRAVGVNDMADPMAAVIRDMVAEYGQAALDELGVEGTFDVEDGAVAKRMESFAAKRVDKLINATTRAGLTDTMRQASYSEAALMEAATSLFDSARETRAPSIATTETVNNSEWATLEGLKQSGMEVKREWLTTLDGLERESHAALDGQAVGQAEPFVIPPGVDDAGARAMYPSGFGIGRQDINCRCTVSNRLANDNENTAPTREQRDAQWRKVDAKRAPWEKDLTDAVVNGFDAQEARVLAAIKDLFA